MFGLDHNNPDCAIVIKIGHRYFSGFCEDGTAQTSWALPGAKVFGAWNAVSINNAQLRLRRLKTKFELVTIGVSTHAA